jgi:hypothetical protein
MVPPDADRSRPNPDLQATHSSCRTGLTRCPRRRQAGATYAANGSTLPPHRPHLPPLHHRIHHHPLHCIHLQIAEILCGGVFQTRTSESLSSLRSLIITMPRGDDHLRIRGVPRRAAPAPAAAAVRGLPNAQTALHYRRPRMPPLHRRLHPRLFHRATRRPPPDSGDPLMCGVLLNRTPPLLTLYRCIRSYQSRYRSDDHLCVGGSRCAGISRRSTATSTGGGSSGSSASASARACSREVRVGVPHPVRAAGDVARPAPDTPVSPWWVGSCRGTH